MTITSVLCTLKIPFLMASKGVNPQQYTVFPEGITAAINRVPFFAVVGDLGGRGREHILQPTNHGQTSCKQQGGNVVEAKGTNHQREEWEWAR